MSKVGKLTSYYVLSPISSSWDWYCSQPVYIQVGIPVVAGLLIGGGVFLYLNSKGGITPSGSSSSSVESTPNFDLQGLQDHVSEIISPHMPSGTSPEVFSKVVNEAAAKLYGFDPTMVSVDMVEAVSRGYPVGAGISINNVFPGLLKLSSAPLPSGRPIIQYDGVFRFGDSLLGRIFGTAAESGLDNQAVLYLDKLCATPLYQLLKPAESISQIQALENLFDVNVIKNLCDYLDVKFQLCHSQSSFFISWSNYFDYVHNIPIPTVTC